jgi:hypothetical protein
MEHWLDEALPLRRENLKLIDWFYRLPVNHEIFRVTRRRQSLRTVIENLRSEPQKIRSARQVIGLNGLHEKEKPKPVKNDDALPAERVSVMKKIYGADVPIPRLKSQIAPSARAEIEEAVEATARGWAPERLEAFCLEFPEATRPEKFEQLSVEYQRRVDQRVKEMEIKNAELDQG